MKDEEEKHSGKKIETTPKPENPSDSAESEELEADDKREYPLRDPSEDPRWAVRTVRIWVGLSFFFLAFILILGIFGLFYD